MFTINYVKTLDLAALTAFMLSHNGSTENNQVAIIKANRNRDGKHMNRRTFLKAALGGAAQLGVTGLYAQEAATPAARANQFEIPIHEGQNPSAFIHPSLASSSREKVGLRLINIFDNSISMDAVEFKIQLEAMADAVGSQDFRDAVFFPGGPQSIAICFADLGNNSFRQRHIMLRVPWMDIRRGENYKFDLLASSILSINRTTGPTYLARSLEMASILLNHCPWQGERNVVDLITDGTEREWLFQGDFVNQGKVAEQVDNLARRHEATVNALITPGDRYAPRIEDFAPEYYVTKPGYTRSDGSPLAAGFVKVVSYALDGGLGAQSLVQYDAAMRMAFRRKLILETAQISLNDLRRQMGREPIHATAYPHIG